jgi:hypothetical protein
MSRSRRRYWEGQQDALLMVDAIRQILGLTPLYKAQEDRRWLVPEASDAVRFNLPSYGPTGRTDGCRGADPRPARQLWRGGMYER